MHRDIFTSCDACDFACTGCPVLRIKLNGAHGIDGVAHGISYEVDALYVKP